MDPDQTPGGRWNWNVHTYANPLCVRGSPWWRPGYVVRMRIGRNTEIRPVGGAAGCLVMILVSVLLSIFLTVFVNLLLH